MYLINIHLSTYFILESLVSQGKKNDENSLNHDIVALDLLINFPNLTPVECMNLYQTCIYFKYDIIDFIL